MKELPFDPYDFFGYIMTGLLVLVGIEALVGVPKIVGVEHKNIDLVLISLAAYVVGQLAAGPAKAVLEDLVVHRWLGAPSTNLFRDRKPTVRGFFFPGFYTPLSSQSQLKIIAKVVAEGLTQPRGEGLFEHCRFREPIRTDTVLMARLSTFLNKYGFHRNLAFASLVFGVALAAGTEWNLQSEPTRYALLALAASVLLFYRYLKFYRQYSYELFNAYAGKP